LAGIAAGVWKTVDEFLATRRFTTFTPRMSREEVNKRVRGWERAVRTAIAWAHDDVGTAQLGEGH